MGNVRFITSSRNKARKTTSSPAVFPKILNGTAALHAPALVQDAAFPMINAMLPDRTSQIWSTGPAPPGNNSADIVLDIDLGTSPPAIACAGILGFSYIGASGGFPQTIQVLYQTSTYDGTAGFAGPVPSSTAIALRDEIILFNAPITARYWRFNFPNAGGGTTGFTLASVFLGLSPTTDLGFLYSGATETIITPESIVEGYGATPTITKTGVPYRRFALTYQNIDQATKDTWEGLYAETYPFIYIDPFDNAWECVMDPEFPRDHIWALPNRYTFVANMRSLP